MNLIIARQFIERSWKFNTSYCDNDSLYHSNHPSFYQCKTSTRLLHRLIGGKIMMCEVNGRSHAFNLINDVIVDLTWSQFEPGSTVEKIVEATKYHLVKNSWEMARYMNLKNAFKKLCPAVNI